MEDRLPRKLTAILYADVADYSRLTGADEDATHRTLSEYLDLVSATVESHGGQIVHYAGDAVLARYQAVVDAVSCAVAIQNELEVRNTGLPDERMVRFRIGVNLGDVIEDRGDIYGDGVNVAARLEALAEPGGICISDAVRSAVGKRMDLDYEDMGEQQVKNIEEPVRAYRVVLDGNEGPAGGSTGTPLSEKPFIAVLPFTNMSGDPEQEYFSDGITEDIITELSRFRELMVIARHSSFYYKNKPSKVSRIGKELGVQYVVEGSVRKSGERVRITVQLIEVMNEAHVWAERYDRSLGDVLAVQDEVTRAIVSVLAGQVIAQSQTRAAHLAAQNCDAYDYVLRGEAIISETNTDNDRARDMYARALELDPECARAHAGMAGTLLLDWTSDWGESPDKAFEDALGAARKALTLDEADIKTRWVLGKLYIFRREYEKAEVHLARALALNPNDADGVGTMALLHIYSGRPELAIDLLTGATRLNPFGPAWHHWFLGFAQYVSKQYETAITTLERSIATGPRFITPRRHLSASYAQAGREREARAEVREILGLDPQYTIGTAVRRLPFKSPAALEHYMDGLRKAGLPE